MAEASLCSSLTTSFSFPYQGFRRRKCVNVLLHSLSNLPLLLYDANHVVMQLSPVPWRRHKAIVAVRRQGCSYWNASTSCENKLTRFFTGMRALTTWCDIQKDLKINTNNTGQTEQWIRITSLQNLIMRIVQSFQCGTYPINNLNIGSSMQHSNPGNLSSNWSNMDQLSIK